MAYVALSRDLINRIEARIRKMKHNEIASTYPDKDAHLKVDASHMYNMGCWGKEHMHLIAQIPKEWLVKEESPTVRVRGVADIEGFSVPQDIMAHLQFLGCTAAYRRPSTDYWSKASSELTIEDVHALPEGTFGRAEAIARFDQAVGVAQIEARWTKLEKDIMGFLEKCKSLNEAIKLLPSIKMYVNSDDIERVERKVARAPREDLLVDVDAGAITAAAIAAKLSEELT